MTCHARSGLTALILVVLPGLSACASAPEPPPVETVRYAAPATFTAAPPRLSTLPPAEPKLVRIPEPAQNDPSIVKVSKHLSCVPFARVRSGISLAGNAGTWWTAAKGKYVRSHTPTPGAVMVFTSGKRLRRGHVAVVRTVVSDREIRIDHANWMNDGRIYQNASVIDVSKNNDWSKVRVWNNLGGGQIGTRVYAISGFIGPTGVEDARKAAIN